MVSLLGMQFPCPTMIFLPEGCAVRDRRHSLFLGLARNISFFADQTVFLAERRKEGVALGIIVGLWRMEVFHSKSGKKCQEHLEEDQYCISKAFLW